jgi:two-component system, NarL family, response regulator LiaR
LLILKGFKSQEKSLISVIVGDKQPAFREGLCRSLAEMPDMQVAAQTGDGQEFITLCASLKPDVVIIDIALPKINGIDATKKLKSVSPDTSVLVVSAFDSQTFALSSLRAGAAGFLTKDTPLSDLIRAVRLIHAGEGIIARSTGENIIRNLSPEQDARQGLELYPREIEVLKLTAKGLRNKEIAKELNISERTVQAHLSNIFSKLEVESRTEAVLKALKDGRLDIGDLR